MTVLRFFALAAILFCAAASTANAQKTPKPPTSFWPKGVAFDSNVPSPKQYLGFEIGRHHLYHHQLEGYLRKLAESSDRVQLQQYGRTHGRRPLLLLAISSPDNLKRLDEIKQRHRQLADPKTAAEVDTSDLPAVINMGYGVHGDEASATNCSPLVAHYLAAARGKEVESWLSKCVILLDPCLNPDGFNRFASWVNAYRGRLPNADPQHAEHIQGWPAGRVNYYWFDLNRDWLPVEHPESRSRMKWYHAWKPNIVLDFHEMGTNSTYFFQPGVPSRTNPLTPAKNIELTNRFGDYHARALDRRGSLYFTQERFDDFYMGKGSTYPDLHGAVGILFEQASARGHIQRNENGLLRFHDAIANHFATSLSSLRATSDLRAELLDYKKTFYADSLRQAKSQPHKAIVFRCDGNWTRLKNFANVLLRHDIQCYWPREPVEADGKLLRPGEALVVPTAQPEYRFLKSLLMRRKNFQENIFYDVSSWTLPLAYNLRQFRVKEPIDLNKLDLVKINGKVPGAKRKLAIEKETLAYLIDYRDDASVTLLNRLLNQGVHVKVATTSFKAVIYSEDSKQVEQSFDYGTLLVPLGIQPKKRKKIESILKKAVKNQVAVYASPTGLTPTGSDFGSQQFRKIQLPKIAMLTGPGTSQYAGGEIWHLLDSKHAMQMSMLKTTQVQSTDLQEYTTVIFPTGSYRQLKTQDWEKIAQWAKTGKTVVALGASSKLIARRLTGDTPAPSEPDTSSDKNNTQLPFDTAARTRALQLISGAIFNTKIDLTHPLFYGYSSDRLPVFRDHASFLDPSKNPYCNPGIYDADRPHLAGYCSQQNVEKFKQSASVVVVPMGRGQLIQISDNPNFRAFWHGTSRLFLNALYFGNLVKP